MSYFKNYINILKSLHGKLCTDIVTIVGIAPFAKASCIYIN